MRIEVFTKNLKSDIKSDRKAHDEIFEIVDILTKNRIWHTGEEQEYYDVVVLTLDTVKIPLHVKVQIEEVIQKSKYEIKATY